MGASEMPPKNEWIRPRHHPRNLRFRGREYHFDSVAPITGDSIYEATDDRGILHRMIVTNPNARERQSCRV
jgi:hypothetical protein